MSADSRVQIKKSTGEVCKYECVRQYFAFNVSYIRQTD